MNVLQSSKVLLIITTSSENWHHKQMNAVTMNLITKSDTDDKSDMEAQLEDDIDDVSFIHAMKLLSNPQYHLVDAYPFLCKVYTIAVEIPISSCTAEHTFSVLKRMKSCMRSSMLQERLEALLFIDIEKTIVSVDSVDVIICNESPL